MTRQITLLALALLLSPTVSLRAQSSAPLVGQPRFHNARRGDATRTAETVSLYFGTDAGSALITEFTLTYDRRLEPKTGTIEMVVSRNLNADGVDREIQHVRQQVESGLVPRDAIDMRPFAELQKAQAERQPSALVERRAMTFEEFAQLAESDILIVQGMTLQLVPSQRRYIEKQVSRWTQ